MRFGWSRLVLCAPFFLVLLAFWLLPIAESFNISIQSNSIYRESEYVGFKNYALIAEDSRYWRAIVNTVMFTSATCLLSVVIGTALAFCVRASAIRSKAIFAFVFMLPGLCPPTVMAFLFLLVFHGSGGFLNKWFVIPFGFEPINWLTDSRYIMPALVIQAVWRWAGFMSFFIGCAMDAVPISIVEASRLDGANRWDSFSRITFPLVLPTVFFCLLYMCVDSIAQFAGSYVLLGGSGGTGDAGLLLVSYAYQRSFIYGDFGVGAAVGFSTIPFLAGLVLLLAFLPKGIIRKVW